MECEHAWVGQPEIGSHEMARYRCSLCGGYGWRTFPSRIAREKYGAVVMPVRPYLIHGKIRTTPDPQWSATELGAPSVRLAEEKLQKDHEAVAKAGSEKAFERVMKEKMR